MLIYSRRGLDASDDSEAPVWVISRKKGILPSGTNI